jgi:DNA gyrase subunit A
MSVIRAAQAASEDSEDDVQYVFTMTDGGFAKRSRINEYRLTNRGTRGVKAMTLANEQRGVLVGAFIVEDGDEILSITQGGQVVRSPINENFRPTGRATMGVKFVTPKGGDAVAVVARSIEAKVEEELDEALGSAAAAVADDAVVEVVEREIDEGPVSADDGPADPSMPLSEVLDEPVDESLEQPLEASLGESGPESENGEADATIDGDDASQ